MKHNTMNQLSVPQSSSRLHLPRRSLWFLVAAGILVALAWGWRLIDQGPAIEASTVGEGRISPAFLEPAELDRLIGVYEGRIGRHTDALDYRTLGYLYLEDARVGGDVSRYQAAAEAFTTASDLYPADPVSRIGIASARYALHDFSGALDAAEQVYRAVPRADALAVMADANLALGNYELAIAQVEDLARLAPDDPGVLVRQAELARLDGRIEQGAGLAADARTAAAGPGNRRRSAWFQSFEAQMAFYLGDYASGLELAEAAVENDPAAVDVAVTLGRLLAATGDLEGAAGQYERATVALPDPAYLVELGDVYTALGQEAEAEEQYATVEVAATLAEAQGVYDRVIALYLADHGLEPERAVDIAQAELELRDDVGAWDTLAWTLYSAGRYEEAEEAASQALARGTVDARFPYHAGMIAAELGEEDAARGWLQAALDLSPQFQPLQADRARQALEGLG